MKLNKINPATTIKRTLQERHYIDEVILPAIRDTESGATSIPIQLKLSSFKMKLLYLFAERCRAVLG